MSLTGCGRKIGPYDCCTVVCGDCLELMKVLPDGCVDAVITDPPYGVGLSYDSFSDTRGNAARIYTNSIPEMRRVSKRVLLTCGVSQISLCPPPDWILAWYCPSGAALHRWGFGCWQPIMAYGSDPYLASCMGGRADVIEHTETSESNGHPCPKPIELWKKILLRGSAVEGETILDPFLGSGTTAVAAKKLGRHFLGFEISPEYCRIAEERIRLVGMKPTLFEALPEQIKLAI